MQFIIGVLSGIGLSTIALFGAVRLAKPISDVFTVNPINTTVTTPQTPIRPAIIIKREDPLAKFDQKDE